MSARNRRGCTCRHGRRRKPGGWSLTIIVLMFLIIVLLADTYGK